MELFEKAKSIAALINEQRFQSVLEKLRDENGFPDDANAVSVRLVSKNIVSFSWKDRSFWISRKGIEQETDSARRPLLSEDVSELGRAFARLDFRGEEKVFLKEKALDGWLTAITVRMEQTELLAKAELREGCPCALSPVHLSAQGLLYRDLPRLRMEILTKLWDKAAFEETVVESARKAFISWREALAETLRIDEKGRAGFKGDFLRLFMSPDDLHRLLHLLEPGAESEICKVEAESTEVLLFKVRKCRFRYQIGNEELSFCLQKPWKLFTEKLVFEAQYLYVLSACREIDPACCVRIGKGGKDFTARFAEGNPAIFPLRENGFKGETKKILAEKRRKDREHEKAEKAREEEKKQRARRAMEGDPLAGRILPYALCAFVHANRGHATKNLAVKALRGLSISGPVSDHLQKTPMDGLFREIPAEELEEQLLLLCEGGYLHKRAVSGKYYDYELLDLTEKGEQLYLMSPSVKPGQGKDRSEFQMLGRLIGKRITELPDKKALEAVIYLTEHPALWCMAREELSAFLCGMSKPIQEMLTTMRSLESSRIKKGLYAAMLRAGQAKTEEAAPPPEEAGS